MKAPEKIYIFENPISNESDDIWLSSRNFKKDTEYIRKDVFIEKACSWLKENYKDYIIVDIDNKYDGIDGLFLEDFKKYMKGE